MAAPRQPAADAPYEEWRSYVKYLTGFTGPKLTGATRAMMAQAKGGQGNSGNSQGTPPTTDPRPGYKWVWQNGAWEEVKIPKNETPTQVLPPGYEWVWNEQTQTWGFRTVGSAPPAPGGDADTQSAKQYLTDLLTQYGLAELIPAVDDLIKQWGTQFGIIQSRLRSTDAYKRRFKGNEDRIKNGYTALTEAEYLSAEDGIKRMMRRYELAGDFYTQDRLAGLIAGDVSAEEVGFRISQAKKVIDSADPNIKSALMNLYGAQMGDMLGYVLDPTVGEEVLQRRVNAGFAAGVAQGVGIYMDSALSEKVGDLTMGDERTLRSQFSQIGELADSTERLAYIDNEKITDSDVVRSQYGLDEAMDKKVRLLQSRERARFGGASSTGRSTLSGPGV